MTPQRRWLVHSIVIAVVLTLAAAPVDADCVPYPVTEHSPTGTAGCVVYGEGDASMWGGPGIARSDCLWPWQDCQPISIQSLDTGVTIIVTPAMFGDLWLGLGPEETGPNGERPRIVDLDPDAVAALGLEPSRGLWRVRVQPFYEGIALVPALPDTSIRYTSMVGVSDESVRIPRGPGSLAYSKSAGVIAWEHGE